MTLITRSTFVAVGVLGGALLCGLPARAQVAPAAPVAPARAGAEASATAWTTYKGDKQRTGGSDAKVTLPLALQWRFSSLGPARTYTTTPLVIGAPGRQRVIFASGDTVYALDSTTGAQVWKSPALASTVIVPLTLLPTDAGDLILALQNSGKLVALKSTDGGRAWQTDAGSLTSEAGPIVVQTNKGTRIIVALNNGRLIAMDEKGVIDPDWRVQLGTFGVNAASSMSLSQDGSRLFILGSDARLYFINVREARVIYSLQQASRSGVTPVAFGDTVFTANARRVAAWKIGDGSPKWTVSPTGDVVGSPALLPNEDGSGTLFFGTRSGQFLGVDVTSGAINWQKDLGKTVNLTGSPLALRGLVIVGTNDGILMGFNPADGALLWQYRLQTERLPDLQPPTNTTGFQPAADGNGFAGGGNGFGGGGDQGGADTTQQQERTYGVSSAPAAIDGQVFVLGDNASLYAFTAQPFDADPPRIVEPSIAVNATDRQLLSLLVTPENPQIVPGVGPFYFATQIDDVGSGVDPNSVKVSLDDTPVDAARVYFGVPRGVLTVTLVDPAKGDPALTDGLKKITISVRDYAGNETNFTTNFMIDNTAPAPTPPVDTTATPDGGGGGGGFQGGGNFGP